MQSQTVIENEEENVEVTIKFNKVLDLCSDNGGLSEAIEQNYNFHNWTDEEFDHWLDSMDWTQDCDPLGTPEQRQNSELRELMTTMGEDDYWNQLILDGVISEEDYLYLDY